MIVRPHTELAVFRGDNPALRAALADLPGFTDAEAAVERVVQASRNLPEAQFSDPTVALGDNLRTLVESGQPLPADLARHAADAQAQQSAALLIQQALTGLVQEFSERQDSLLRANADPLLRHLNGQLSTLVADLVDPLAKLGAADTAEDAVAAGVGDEWRRLGDSYGRYQAIRAAQSMIHRHLIGERDSLHEHAALIGNTLDMFGDWPAWHSHGFLVDQHGAQKVLAAPWPDPSSLGYLRWLVTSDAQPWVPTRAQYEQARDRLRAALRREREPYQPATRTEAEPSASVFTDPGLQTAGRKGRRAS